MTPRTRSAAGLVAVAASVLVLTACVGVQTDGVEPTPTGAATPRTTSTPPAPEPLAIPDRTPGELSRVVFSAQGRDGVPTSDGEVKDAPVAGVEYTVEGVCTTLAGFSTVTTEFHIYTTADPQEPISSGTILCDGESSLSSGEILTSTPPQLTFAMTDGVAEAYVRILPTDEYLAQN